MARPTTLEVLFQSEHLIAVNKPSRLATIPGRGEQDSVLERLSLQLDLPRSGSADPRLRVVHRLDKDTSGVLLFAKDIIAQRHLSHQFQNNRVHKEYLAIVAGRPDSTDGEIDAPLAPHPSRTGRMTVPRKGGKAARTLWKLERSFRGFSLLRLFPQTGKTHQIRVHLVHIGLPLAVDPLYHPSETSALFLSAVKRDYRPKRNRDERPLIDRLTLHAEKLRFEDLDGHAVEVVAPLPKDFRATINQLSKVPR